MKKLKNFVHHTITYDITDDLNLRGAIYFIKYDIGILRVSGCFDVVRDMKIWRN